MSTSAELLARELAELKRRITAMERKSQVGNSTIDIDGVALPVRDCIRTGFDAEVAAAEALDIATSAEAKADGAVVTYFGDTAPGPGAKFGDLWRDSDGMVRQYDGDEWQDITDPETAAAVGEALDRLSVTEAALDGKITTYYTSSVQPPQNLATECAPNGGFESTLPGIAWNTQAGSYERLREAAKTGDYGYRMTASTTGNRYVTRAGCKFPTSEGRHYHIELDARLVAGTSTANGVGAACVLYSGSTGGTSIGSGVALRADNGPTSASDGWVHISGDYTMSNSSATFIVFSPWLYKNTNGAVYDIDNFTVTDLDATTDQLRPGDLWIVTDCGNLIRRWSGTEWVDAPLGPESIAEHAVTASKLEADLVLASRVIAGAENGKRAEMNPDGFHVYVPDAQGGVREVARLGVAGQNDSLIVSHASGESMASISEDGVVSGTQFNSNSVFYKGDELDIVLDNRPRGIIARGVRTTYATYNSAGYVRPYLRVDAVLHPGRQYRVWTSPINMTKASNGNTIAYLGYKVGEQATTANFTLIQAQRVPLSYAQVMFNEPFQLPSTYTTSQTVSFLLAHGAEGGAGRIEGETNRPVHLVIEDVGRAVDDTGITVLNATSDRADLMDRQTYAVNHSKVVRYINGSTSDTTGAQFGNGYIGKYTDSSSALENVTYISFPDITAAISGRTVLGIRVQIPIQLWSNPSGKDSFDVSLHGYAGTATAPSSLPTLSAVATATGVPAPSTRWVSLPDSTFAAFKSGQARGVLLHRPSNRTSGYWGALGVSAGDQLKGIDPVYAVLEVTYQ